MASRLLSNGRYSTLISDAGTGYSKWNGLLLTAWTGDRTEDGDGFFVYLRDLDSGRFWSVGDQPVPSRSPTEPPQDSAGGRRIARRDEEIDATLEVWVAADDDVEIRSLRLHNRSPKRRRLDVTTYAEVVLNFAPAHAAHPAFSKLFVQTDFDSSTELLLARRRPRSSGEHYPWMLHGLYGGASLQYETDRARFIGRNRTLAAPQALLSSAPLSNTAGNVLNPSFSVRRAVTLEPGADVELTIVLGAADSREAACALGARYRDGNGLAASRAQAASHEQALLAQLGLADAEAARFQDLAGAMLYGKTGLRAAAEIIHRTDGALSDLYQYGARLDWLLAAVEVDRRTPPEFIAQVVKAREYWVAKGLSVQLWLVCDEPALAEELRKKFVKPNSTEVIVLQRGAVPAAHIDRLETAAHLVASGSWPAVPPAPSRARAGTASSRMPFVPASTSKSTPIPNTAHFNGIGGFSLDGKEYIIALDPSAGNLTAPPTPWTNAVSNERFGFLVSESGAGNTWSRNSRENRLTPWLNDPISDPHEEALYLRDDDTGVFWSPQPGPTPDSGSYEVAHGFGYSRWKHTSQDLEQEVLQFVPREDPLKVTRLTLTNRGTRRRRLSVLSYNRLVLGVVPEDSARFIVTRFDAAAAAVLASNRLNNEFSDGVVFAASVSAASKEKSAGAHGSYTADRPSFLGPEGSPAEPAAVVAGGALDGKTGAALDPCFALQLTVVIEPGATAHCAFLLGETTAEADVRTLVERYRRPGAIDTALQEVHTLWDTVVSAVRVQTPSPAIDLMLNGWLLYQVLSCRVWGRSAFYQSGGAFGFRDQLQDSAALVHARPDLSRAQIVLHAAHQFPEGDVLHWWHPPTNRGIRTRFSDDLLWLPYLTAFYIQRTGDFTVLDEQAAFVSTRQLNPGEDEAYLYPETTKETADVYQHCCLSLDRSLTRGAHGLPLMGTGDWNDGMNRVGREGRGESVWLGFFLSTIIDDFVPICERRNDHERAQRYRAYQADLKQALEGAAWDGRWYRRAYYDDGSPLGTASDHECRIDAIAQAWAVISKVASPEHATQAMASAEAELVSEPGGFIRLLTPAFDQEPRDPGYIKGYLPGIRENGGQYTHGAMWVVQAFAEMGRRDRAGALLEMLSPVSHTRTLERIETYQVEPYVIVADIYGVAPHVGRGGWTWYTGSAAWMYRIGLESVLGIYREGPTLRIKPCIPDEWPEARVTYRLPGGKTAYEIVLDNPSRKAAAVKAVTVDGRASTAEAEGAVVTLVDDNKVHRVVVTLG